MNKTRYERHSPKELGGLWSNALGACVLRSPAIEVSMASKFRRRRLSRSSSTHEMPRPAEHCLWPSQRLNEFAVRTPSSFLASIAYQCIHEFRSTLMGGCTKERLIGFCWRQS